MSNAPIIVEDVEHRCDWHFVESMERCWLVPSKTLTYQGELRGTYCIYHYEVALQALAQEIAKERQRDGREEEKLKL